MRPSQSRDGLRVLGVDASLTSTGYAYHKPDGTRVTGRILPGERKGPERLFWLRYQMGRLLDLVKPDFIALEGYAMGFGGGGRKGKGGPAAGRVFDIGELGGVYKTLFYERGIPTIVISPSTLKLVISGRGRHEKKIEMSVALKQKFGITIQQNDEADAYGLLVVGELRTGISQLPEEVRQSLRTDAIKNCDVIPGKLKLIAT